MFTLTVTGDTLAEVAARLLAAADAIGDVGNDAPSASSGSASSGSAKNAAGGSQAKKASSQTEADKPPGGGSAKKAASEDDGDDDDGLDYDKHVRPVAVKLSKTHGREAALDVLSAFDTADGETCANAKDLQPTDWAAAVKKLEARQKKLDKEKAAAAADDD